MTPSDAAQDPQTSGDEPMIGEYANEVSVGSTQTEFYIDFYQYVPGSDGDHMVPVRRLLISPMLMRSLVKALEDEIGNYETTYHVSLPVMES